jgi:hypothetical protein
MEKERGSYMAAGKGKVRRAGNGPSVRPNEAAPLSPNHLRLDFTGRVGAGSALKVYEMNRRARLLTTAFVAAGLIASETCNPERTEGVVAQPVPEFQAFRDPIEREPARHGRETLLLLAARDYDGLEARARAAREEKQRFADGTWKLHRFYTALAPAENAPEAAWEHRLSELKAWVAARPSSLTGAIALAEVYNDYAWKTRSTDAKAQAQSVNQITFRERMESALQVLENARALGVTDPHYWRVAHSVAVGLNWPASSLENIHEQAVALEPEYWSNDIARLAVLLARGDDSADLEPFVAQIAAAAAHCSSEETYARIAWEVSQLSGNSLEETAFDWPRVQAGYRALLKRFPTSTGLLSQYCVLACRARDKAAARRCFVKLGGRADLHAFGTHRDYMRDFRWANWN